MPNHRLAFLLLSVVPAMLAGCATQSKPPVAQWDTKLPMVAVSGPAPSEDAARAPFIMLTPATRLSDGNGALYIPGGTYTRLHLTAVDASNTDSSNTGRDVYPYRTRSAVSRLFIGKRHSVTFAAKVNSGIFVATVPLLTVEHDSTRAGGELFNRVIRQEASQFPLFLVRANSASDIASVALELKGADRSEAPAAARALSAVVAAAKLIAPVAPLLTTLSQSGAKDVANALDATISKLFSEQITEQHIVDRSIRRWKPLVIDLFLPRDEGGWSKLKADRPDGVPITLGMLDYVHVATWTISFEPSRVSAFASVTVKCPDGTMDDEACRPALTAARAAAVAQVRAQPGDVLSFSLNGEAGTTGTLFSYLRQLDWWTRGVKQLASPTDADGFCRSIRGALTDVGFNDLDARLAAEAVVQSSLLTSAEGDAIKHSTECIAE